MSTTALQRILVPTDLSDFAAAYLLQREPEFRERLVEELRNQR